MNNHLSDEEFSQMLAGTGDAEAALHLESCAVCRREFETVKFSLLSMNSLGAAWAEQQAPHRIPVPLHRSYWSGRSMWLIPATLMALCVSLFTLSHQERRNPDLQFGASSTPQSMLADDNRLMTAIDYELNIEVVPQVPVSELREATIHPRDVSAQTVNE